MLDRIIDFITILFVEYPEGMFLYTGGMITVTLLNLFYLKAWDEGAKGTNKLWDIPEQLFVLFVRWIIPHMFISAYCLPDVAKVSDSLLWFAAALALYALTGRWGLEWLATMRGTVVTKKEVTKEETHEETTTTSKQRSSDTGTTNLSDIN
jgi:hypothetical protein